MGVSRDTFYRYRELADEGAVDALINRSNLKNRTDEATGQTVVNYAVAFPKAIDDAVMDSNEAQQEMMVQYLFNPELAKGFARVVFDM